MRRLSSINKDFDQYTLDYDGGEALQSGNAGAVFNCYKSNTYVGSIIFWSDKGPTPPNSYDSARKAIVLYYEMSRFNDVVTLLRLEKCLQLGINSTTLRGGISINRRVAVGEQAKV